MANSTEMHGKALKRLYGLLNLQQTINARFGEKEYNIFVFGSYLTTGYKEGQSDIDIAIYTENFDMYKRLSAYLEEYFNKKGIDSDIFYIDLDMEAPIYCAPLESKVQFTDYFPQKLVDFQKRCQSMLEENKMRLAYEI